MKRKFLLTAVALLCAVGMWADTDKTSSVSTTWYNSDGETPSGTAKSSAAPYVTPSGGSSVAMYEDYNGTNTAATGILLQQTVSGLTNGTYKVEFYANAMHANNVTQSATSYTNARVYVFANTQYKQVTPEEKNSTTQNGEYTINNVVVSDGTLKLGLYKHSAGTNWHTIQIKSLTLLSNALATNTASLMNASTGSPIDATDFLPVSVITNSDATGWDFTGSGRNYSHGVWEVYNQTYKLEQTLSNMPNGRYVVKVQGYYRAGGGGTTSTDQNVKLFANGVNSDVLNILSDSYAEQPGTGKWSQVNSKYVPNDRQAGGYAFYMSEKYKNNSVTAYVTDNTLHLGLEKTVAVSYDWSLFNGFEIKCIGLYVSAAAGEFTSGNAIAADSWYAFTVPSSGWYTITPTTAGTFSYTQDGTQIVDASFSRFYATTTGKYQYLTAGTFYFKTNTAATVTIASTAVHAGDNVTGYINDPSFEHVALSNSGTVTSTDLLDWLGTSDAPEAFISYKINDRNYTNVDGNNLYNTWGGSPANGYYLKQTLRNLPIGKYRMSCYVSSDSPNTVNVAFGGSSEDATCTGKTNGVQASVDLTNESAGDVLINLSSTTWFKADVFQLTLLANLIVNDVEELPVSGAMEAGKWYYFTAGADDKWIDAPTPANIVFTTDGSQFTDISGTALSDMTMTSGTKYYIKSSSSQTVAVSEQTIANGTYYLYNPYTGRFLGGGATYGTSALVDKYGVPFNLELHADGYMLKFVDWNKYLYGPNWLYVDGDNGVKFKIVESTVGGYTGYEFYNKSATSNNRLYVYMKDGGDKYHVAGNAIIGDNCDEEEQTVWQFKTVSEHNTIVNAYPTENINNVIAAASIETDAAGFETYLSTYYDASDVTNKIPTAKFVGNVIGDWTWTVVKDKSTHGGYRYETAWQWQRTGSYTQTIDKANFPAGIYKLVMGGFDRHASEAEDISYASSYGSLSSSYLKANDEQVRMKAWADVEGRPTGEDTQANAINNGQADNVLYLYLDGSTDLNLTVCKPAYLDNCYFNFGNFRLTRYTLKAADASDYAALNTAIAAHTLGFEDGEYAPYNNIEAIPTLTAAEEIDQEASNNKIDVQTAITNLNGASWTANDGEVSAINLYATYDADNKDAENRVYAPGWGKAGGSDAYNTRFMQGSTSNAGMAAVDDELALFTKYSTTYGLEDGYTMPLKANTVYKLSFKYGAWGENKEIVSHLTIKDGSNTSVSLQPSSSFTRAENTGLANESTAAWFDFECVFKTNDAGNYKLELTKDGNNEQRQIVMGNIVLKKAAGTLSEDATSEILAGYYKSVTLTRTLVGGQWNGFSVPFSFTIAGSALEGARVMEFESVDANLLMVTEATEVVAGEPYLIKPATNIVNPTFNGVTVTNPAEVVKGGENPYKFQAHLYNTDLADDGTIAYMSTTNSVVKRLAEGGHIKGLRAVFQVPAPSEAKPLIINFGDADGILTLDADGNISRSNAEIFNLAGQRLSKAQKGVNIINGKKVLVK